LPGLGGKIFFKVVILLIQAASSFDKCSKVEEYVTKGSIPEVEETRASERYQALACFTTVYGVGPSRAREYFDMGMRSIADLERFYDVQPPDFPDPESPQSISMVNRLLQELKGRDNEETYTPSNGKKIPTKGTEKAPEITIPVALVLRRELDTSIPREEVEEIREVIMRELDDFQPGCVSTIVGGYVKPPLFSRVFTSYPLVDIEEANPEATMSTLFSRTLTGKTVLQLSKISVQDSQQSSIAKG
jgi:Fingers domain of DNA polymerase lambda